MSRPPPRIASRLLTAAAAVFATLSVQVPAYADDVYLCTGPNGVPEYRNSGNVKGCKKLTLPDVVIVPGARSSRSADVAPAPAQNNAGGGFPRVDNATQKVHDGECRQALEAELADEECKLQALKAEYNNGRPECQGDEHNCQKYLDRTAQLKGNAERNQTNVDSIRRELDSPKE